MRIQTFILMWPPTLVHSRRLPNGLIKFHTFVGQLLSTFILSFSFDRTHAWELEKLLSNLVTQLSYNSYPRLMPESWRSSYRIWSSQLSYNSHPGLTARMPESWRSSNRIWSLNSHTTLILVWCLRVGEALIGSGHSTLIQLSSSFDSTHAWELEKLLSNLVTQLSYNSHPRLTARMPESWRSSYRIWSSQLSYSSHPRLIARMPESWRSSYRIWLSQLSSSFEMEKLSSNLVISTLILTFEPGFDLKWNIIQQFSVRVEKCRYTVSITCVYQKCQFRVPMKDFVWPTNFHFALGDKNVFIQLILVRNL